LLVFNGVRKTSSKPTGLLLSLRYTGSTSRVCGQLQQGDCGSLVVFIYRLVFGMGLQMITGLCRQEFPTILLPRKLIVGLDRNRQQGSRSLPVHRRTPHTLSCSVMRTSHSDSLVPSVRILSPAFKLSPSRYCHITAMPTENVLRL
jgi:hypothetical protein